MAGLVMVRTVCCETFKCSGVRCSICPNRPENREAVENYKRELAAGSFGRRLGSTPRQQIFEEARSGAAGGR